MNEFTVFYIENIENEESFKYIFFSQTASYRAKLF